MATTDRALLAERGLDPDAVDALVSRAGKEIEEGLLPSCQLALARDGEVLVDVTLGKARQGSRFVIFSCTKAIVAAGMWKLLGDGALALDTRPAELIPEFGTEGKDAVTTQQLLTHTAGFPFAPLGPPEWSDRQLRLQRFARWRLNWEPGTRYEYHPTSAHWVLAELIERVTGTDYRRWIRDEILSPLGLDAIRLGAPDGEEMSTEGVVPCGSPPSADELEAALGVRLDLADLQGEVTEEAKTLLAEPAVLAVGVPGGGAISTAGALALFYQALLANPGGFWDPEMLELGTSTVLCDLPDPILGHPAHRTLGLTVAGDQSTAPLLGFGRAGSPRRFGHMGAGGQIAWADPDTGLSFAYLTSGHDAHLIREARRTTALSSRAALCADPAS